MKALEVTGLSAAYDGTGVLDDISFTLDRGALAGIIGPNGSGKTTLLKSIMGIVKPASGEVRLFGEPLNAVRDKVSYVPQRQSVDWDFPATVIDVARMGRYKKGKLFGRLSAEDKKAAEEALEKTGLTELRNRQISALSGGQQQRVFIARALAQAAEIYFMDEPFAGIDAASEAAIAGLLGEMRDAGKTVVLVHHDLHTAAGYFNSIALLNRRLVAFGPPKEVLNTTHLRAAYGVRFGTSADIFGGTGPEAEKAGDR